ncbi:hypothetical protein THAOC_25209 [Thalassiosira oceanica]|uniref:Uncharacterized protein n=1 Tax=Thalassiosira oceanica TaxID=159749 RepID=K0S250_THAOC|nr:hypothetical protein THAOC_25209 [Thalassiosira oceanica]|eukprot:EJK55091.1 hypothetical protein THAOC_25209 [Thalassiosira oceanica]
MDAPESPEVQDDAIDAAMAGRFDTWVKVRIEALREAAEGRHRGSWVHQRVMAEMPSFGSITELDDFFRNMSVDANEMVERPIDVFDTSCDNDLRVHGVKRGNKIPGGSRVDTCSPTLGVLNQEVVYYCFYMIHDNTRA